MRGLRRLFAAMALVLVVAPLAANAPLFDPDEGLHAAIAQEMVLRGDYVTPTFLGEPFLDKPILFFWAEALSLRVFGNHEAAVRLPPLLFGALAMAAVAALAWAMFDEATGLLAGIAYGTMLLPLGVSQVAVHDVAVVPFECAACAALVAFANNPRFGGAAVWTALLAGIALGLSILTKGLVGLAFTGILGLCLAGRTPKGMVRIGVFLAAAAAIAAVVAAPWYVLMERAHHGYLHYYFVERHLQGYLTATQRHAGRGWWYYLPIVIGGTLPWTGYLGRALRTARSTPATIVVWMWFAAGLVFLSAGESKLVTYALPVFPALAVLAARAIVSAGGFGRRAAYAVFAGSLGALPIAGLIVVAVKFTPVGGAVWLMTGLASAAIVLVACRSPHSPGLTLERGAALALRLPAMALFGLMIVVPRAAEWMTARDLALALNADGRLPSHVAVIDERIGSLVFYLGPALRADASTRRIEDETVAQVMAHLRVWEDDAVIAVRTDQMARFNRVFAVPPAVDRRAGTFAVFRAGTLRAAAAAGRNP